MRLCAGIVPVKDYVLAENLISNDSTHAAGMQGQPQTLDDLTDGQIEERFYQSVLQWFNIGSHLTMPWTVRLMDY